MKAQKEKIKIAIVAPSLRVVGGQSIQSQRLIDAFATDENVEIFSIPNNPETVFESIKILRTIFTSIKFWLSLFVKIPQSKIVHIFSSGTTSYIISTFPPFFIAKLFCKKTILHYHTGEAETHLRDWKLTAKPTMKRFDKIIVPSQFLVDVFAKFDLKAEAIFNFVESEKFKFRERNSLQPVFLSNRNFEAHYRVSDVLRAFRLIQNRFPGAKLLVAGAGSEEKLLHQLAAELKLENVEFLGRIKPSEMPQVYEKADIYLNASIVDNMPLSFIEAFAAGTPIVSYATGGIPYICEHNETALLVETKDFEALAREAIRLPEDKNLAKKIIAKAQQESVKYSWENVREQWLETYRNLSE
ncbi:MAG TPA: glycosyltransferase family 4 protein [Pyrinomonadaceae bacterium]|nr:glycosyltransferase family 4 protein [Pyrinomonadaceae bacterium]